jgi:hypothetical protein
LEREAPGMWAPPQTVVWVLDPRHAEAPQNSRGTENKWFLKLRDDQHLVLEMRDGGSDFNDSWRMAKGPFPFFLFQPRFSLYGRAGQAARGRAGQGCGRREVLHSSLAGRICFFCFSTLIILVPVGFFRFFRFSTSSPVPHI